jgi:hypothetical protein
LDPEEYEALLIVAGLASYTIRFDFQIKPKAWREFIGNQLFAVDNCAIEFDQKKLDLNEYINGTLPSQLKQRGYYVVRIGNRSKQLPTKIEERMGQDRQLITTPPRMRGIGIK